MTHPSSVLRGKVLSLPVIDLPATGGRLESAVLDVVRAANPGPHVLVSLSEADASGLRVLTVSGSKERSLQRWRALVSPGLDAAGVRADWAKALVLVAAATRHDHG